MTVMTITALGRWMSFFCQGWQIFDIRLYAGYQPGPPLVRASGGFAGCLSSHAAIIIGEWPLLVGVKALEHEPGMTLHPLNKDKQEAIERFPQSPQ